jgi:hypothetical protein
MNTVDASHGLGADRHGVRRRRRGKPCSTRSSRLRRGTSDQEPKPNRTRPQRRCRCCRSLVANTLKTRPQMRNCAVVVCQLSLCAREHAALLTTSPWEHCTRAAQAMEELLNGD